MMENPNFFEAFRFAYELVIKWTFVAAVLLFLGQVVVFMVYFWKTVSSLSKR